MGPEDSDSTVVPCSSLRCESPYHLHMLEILSCIELAHLPTSPFLKWMPYTCIKPIVWRTYAELVFKVAQLIIYGF